MCSAGMSTSTLEAKIREYSNTNKLGIEVSAHSSFEGLGTIKNYDVVLLGPQVKYMLENVRKQANGVPVDVIPGHVYALANAKETIELAMKTMASKK
jgi:PTS system cellobiose-specific IIB component